MKLEFTEDQLSTIRNALSIATDKFSVFGADLLDLRGEGFTRCAVQFERQRNESLALIDKIDEALEEAE